ncbi:PREDICTED: vegetative cell wall protein gp1-like [Papilio polytes]|uniref:vegetative cell wall protein gp1-like n=1 Tax=Papilio polytes TaxID=76194 RepID=UPI0006765E7D|nr:PREDICTED: vegetative cell wall protein gp1-like [Papilio polytes]
MKIAFILLFALYYTECRKVYPPIDKNANLAFINMESGGMRPGQRPANPAPAVPAPTPANVTPKPTPAPVPTTIKAVPAKPIQTTQAPPQIKPVPVYPSPAGKPVTTPGPGSVQHLINFYDSQGKASVIRPYSYSQAVKQG